MDRIEEKYIEKCAVASDIHEHLPTLLRYAQECDHITEMGVRTVCSTWALLHGKPHRMFSYDIVRDPNVDEVEALCKEAHIDFNFVEADVLRVDIERTELLFIDTLHTYVQLKKELRRHARYVSRYIILHDTMTFGDTDEKIYRHASVLIRPSWFGWKGLNPAIRNFLRSVEGRKWQIHEVFTNNNGLTILKRR